MTQLTERVALVTGASGGIGAGIAQMLASDGAQVVLAARREEQLERVANSIRAAGGFALAVVTDLSDDKSLANLVERTRVELGPIDVLVNNAGLCHMESARNDQHGRMGPDVRRQPPGCRLPVCGRTPRYAAARVRADHQYGQ